MLVVGTPGAVDSPACRSVWSATVWCTPCAARGEVARARAERGSGFLQRFADVGEFVVQRLGAHDPVR